MGGRLCQPPPGSKSGRRYNWDRNGTITVARNIINEADRTQPAKPFQQTAPDYVAVSLTTEDDRYSNRKFKAVNTLLAGSVPIRARLSVTQ